MHVHFAAGSDMFQLQGDIYQPKVMTIKFGWGGGGGGGGEVVEYLEVIPVNTCADSVAAGSFNKVLEFSLKKKFF